MQAAMNTRLKQFGEKEKNLIVKAKLLKTTK